MDNHQKKIIKPLEFAFLRSKMLKIDFNNNIFSIVGSIFIGASLTIGIYGIIQYPLTEDLIRTVWITLSVTCIIGMALFVMAENIKSSKENSFAEIIELLIILEEKYKLLDENSEFDIKEPNQQKVVNLFYYSE